MLRKAPHQDLIGTELLQDIFVSPASPDLNIPLLPTIVDASGSALGYTLKPIPKEDLRKVEVHPMKKKLGRPLKLPAGLVSTGLPKARPVGRPPGPLVAAMEEVQIVATLPRASPTLPRATPPQTLPRSAPPPLRAPKPAPLPLPAPNLGKSISITKKMEPRVVDANKARFFAHNGLSLTGSPTNKQNAPNVNKQVSGNKQKTMLQPNSLRPPSNFQATQKRGQQRRAPNPQQGMQEIRGAPHQMPAPCTSGTPEDILRALSSSPAVQQPSFRGSHMKPPNARGMPPYSRRGMPPQARGARPPPGSAVQRGQKMMPTGSNRRILATKPVSNPEPRAWIDGTRSSLNQPQSWAGQKQSNTLRALNQNQAKTVSNLPLRRLQSGFPVGAKQNVPPGVTIAASKS